MGAASLFLYDTQTRIPAACGLFRSPDLRNSPDALETGEYLHSGDSE